MNKNTDKKRNNMISLLTQFQISFLMQLQQQAQDLILTDISQNSLTTYPNQKNLMTHLKHKYPLLFFTLFIILLLTIPLLTHAQSTLYLTKLIDPDALCLDGSPAAYYISKDGDPDKIYLQFEGGGWCWGIKSVSDTLQSCLQRSKTDLGSSKDYPQTITFSNGVLSNNQENNFKNWTRVLLKYCTGTGHQGTRKSPVPYKGTNLFFRGHNVTESMLNSLEKNNKLFSGATQVVVGGDSAGGLAVFLWTNYIKDRVKNGKVWALPDSGIFLDAINVNTGKQDYKSMFKNLATLVNVEIAPPVPECAQKYQDQIQMCLFANNLAPYITAPIYLIQSLYDTWSNHYILGIPCIINGSLANCTSKQIDAIEEYHRNTTNTIFAIAANNQNGFFAPACAIHVLAFGSVYYSPQWRIPQGSQNSQSKSVESWLSGNTDASSYRLIDLGKWPDNKPCSGVQGTSKVRLTQDNQ